MANVVIEVGLLEARTYLDVLLQTIDREGVCKASLCVALLDRVATLAEEVSLELRAVAVEEGLRQ